MITGKTILDYIEELAGHPLYKDEGPRFGNITRSISGITVCWMASPEAILSAVEKKHNFIICHEALTFPYPAFSEEKERQYLSWPTNTQRLTLLGKNDICLCRAHFSLDEVFLYKSFIKQIGIEEVKAAGKGSVFEKIYKRGYLLDSSTYNR
ncbi:MAG: Nif3-like dinuclear metal center hexameric protein [Planctomycetota bacterium]